MKVIKKIFIGIIAVIFFVFAIVMTVFLLNQNEYGVTKLGATSYIIINDAVTAEGYNPGDLVLVNERRVDNVKMGEEIFAYRIHNDDQIDIEIGKVGTIVVEENYISFENGATFDGKFIVGKSAQVFPGLGTILSFILSQWGFLFIVVVPCFLVFVYQLYTLIIEIKYGEEEVIVPSYRY